MKYEDEADPRWDTDNPYGDWYINTYHKRTQAYSGNNAGTSLGDSYLCEYADKNTHAFTITSTTEFTYKLT